MFDYLLDSFSFDLSDMNKTANCGEVFGNLVIKKIEPKDLIVSKLTRLMKIL